MQKVLRIFTNIRFPCCTVVIIIIVYIPTGMPIILDALLKARFNTLKHGLLLDKFNVIT